MTFQEKLQFLMKITQTSNKELAKAISVDPSLISLLRTGRRKLPQNLEHVRKMAAYFTRQSTADYQRQAIAEMLDMPVLRSSLPASRVEEAIFQWMCKESDSVTRLLDVLAEVPVASVADSFEMMEQGNNDISEQNLMKNGISGKSCVLDHTISGDGSDSDRLQELKGLFSAEKKQEKESDFPEFQFFFGSEGKMEALRRSIGLNFSGGDKPEFLVVTGESMGWMLDDYSLRKDYVTKFITALQCGMRVRQIMPSMNLLSRCVDSIRQWLPMYATGQVDAYYYPRMRDNLYSRSMLILPGVYAMVSTALGPDYSEPITLLTTNLRMVEALTKEFYTLLSQCKPALKVCQDPDGAAKCFQKILCKDGDIVQMVSPMSATTAPSELLEECIAVTENKAAKNTYQLYLDTKDIFEERLKQSSFYDLSRLPSAKEILTGEIPIIIPYKVIPDIPCYTPERYILHLRNVLRLLNEYENYHFIPVDDASMYGYNLVTAEEGIAMLVKNTLPPLFLKIERPVIVQACQEHLYRMAGQIGYKGIYREKIKSRIRTLIQELEMIIKDRR